MTFRGDSGRTPWTTLTTAATASVYGVVADATGWQVGDELLFVPASASNNNANHTEIITLAAGYTPGSTTLVLSSYCANTHIIGGRVCNLTRNCVLEPSSATSGPIDLRFDASVATALSTYFRWARFKNMGNSAVTGGLAFTGAYANVTTATKYKSGRIIDDIDSCVFYRTTGNGVPHVVGKENKEYLPFYDTTFVDVSTGGGGVLLSVLNNMDFIDCTMAATDHVLSYYSATGTTPLTATRCWFSAGTQYTSYFSEHGIGAVGFNLTDCIFSGRFTALFSGTAAATNGVVVDSGSDWGYTYGIYLAFKMLSNVLSAGGYTDFTSTGSKFNTTYTDIFNAPGFTINRQDSRARLWNKNNNTALQEYYTPQCRFSRETTTVKNSTSSIKAEITTTDNIAQSYSFQVPAKTGESLKLIGYLRKNASYGSSTRPTVTASFGGTTLDTHTMTDVTDTWEVFELDFSQSSGTDGLIDITLTVQSSSASAIAYLSGVATSPFVTRARHYGYVVAETSPTRIVDAAISASYATAAAYTDIAITWGATSSISTSADQSFQKLVDYTAAKMIDNVGSALPITWAGVAGSPAIFAAGNIDISGDTLNGGGSLSMGSNTLTATLPWAYTYTGGTFSQVSTVPTFSGGTLNIGAAGTYTFTQAASMTVSATPTSASTYDLSGSTFTGTLTFHNTSAHNITVQIPAGVTANSTGSPGAGTVAFSAPTVARGLDFNGVLTGSTVKVFETGTQTVIATPTAPDWLWSEDTAGSVTVDYTIQKAGYLPIRVTGVTVTAAISGGVQVVTVQQTEASAYVASSGLTFGTNCYANPTTKRFGLTAASTLQNFYARMMESWITEATLQNKPFPLVANGPNSFAFTDDWEWDLATYPNSINRLSRDGMKYKSAAGATTAMWAAILTAGVPAGLQVRYQQSDGGNQGSAATTGNMDELLQIYGDATHGNFDRTGWLVLKVQEEGYDQAEAVHFDIYSQLDDQLYVYGLTPSTNGIAAGVDVPGIAVTSEVAPVEWPTASGSYFSTTITDTASPNTGLAIMQAIRARNDFDMHDMIRPNGAKFKTVTGNLYGDYLITPAGVRVVMNDGVTPHPDFNLFSDDSGTTPYTPPVIAPITWAGALNGTTVLLYNDSNAGAIIDTQAVSGAGGYTLSVTLPHADVAVGDSLRLRYGHKEYYAGELQGTMTASGLAFVGSMTLHPVYAAWGLDGAVYDQSYTPAGPYTMDGTNLQVDIAAGATTGLKTQLGAWTQYLMTLPAGLDAFYGAWDLLALNQIRQNVAVVDVMIDVPTAGALFTFTDNNVNYYRSDFTFPGNVQAGHGLIAMTYNAEPFVATVTGENVITGDAATILAAIPSAAMIANEVVNVTIVP